MTVNTGTRHRAPRAVRRGAVLLGAVLLAIGIAPPAAHADTVRQAQWHLDYLKILDAQKQSQGDGVVVAVIDTGVRPDHPDLQGQLLPGYGIGSDAAPDGLRDTGAKGHGTSMAGLIAARGGSDDKALGIAPKAKILSISTGEETDADSELAPAIRWAADHGARVINMSLSGEGKASQTLLDAVQYAASKDIVLVAGAGNGDFVGVGDPANIPGVLAVGAIDKSGNVWERSNRGPELGLAAPGVQIVSTATKELSASGYSIGDGTSSATAIVSGVAALIRSKYPQLNAASVINRLIRTATDKGPAGRDSSTGFGIVNPVAALTTDVPTVTANPLGVPASGAASPPAQAAPPTENDDLPVAALWIGGAVCLVIVLGLIGLGIFLVVVASRRKRRPATPPAPGLVPGAYLQQPGYGPMATAPPGHRPAPPTGGWQTGAPTGQWPPQQGPPPPAGPPTGRDPR